MSKFLQNFVSSWREEKFSLILLSIFWGAYFFLINVWFFTGGAIHDRQEWLVFIYGLVTYLLSTGDEEKRKEARQVMIWGIIILFVIVVVWGLVAVLENTFNVNRENIPAGPRMIEPRPE